MKDMTRYGFFVSCILVIALMFNAASQAAEPLPYHIVDNNLFPFFKGYVKSCTSRPVIYRPSQEGGWSQVDLGESGECKQDVCENIFDSDMHRIALFEYDKGRKTELHGKFKISIPYFEDHWCLRPNIMSFTFKH